MDSSPLRVWFRDDVTNILTSVYASTSAALSAVDGTPEAEAFRRGHTAALVAVGLAFGISPLVLSLGKEPAEHG